MAAALEIWVQTWDSAALLYEIGNNLLPYTFSDFVLLKGILNQIA